MWIGFNLKATTSYLQHFFADEAKRQIINHADNFQDTPLFLYLALTSPHTPLQAPPELINLVLGICSIFGPKASHKHELSAVPQDKRWEEAIVLCHGDWNGQRHWRCREHTEGEGTLWQQHHPLFFGCKFSCIIKNHLFWQLLITQNGGEFSRGSGGRNYPLRGEKNSMWEGGTRVASFLHSPLIQNQGNSYDGSVITSNH